MHRMASINEYSTRYSPAIDFTDRTPSEQWRAQSVANRQGSGGFLGDDWPEGWTYDPEHNMVKCEKTGEEFSHSTVDPDISTPGRFLSMEERELQELSRQVYDRRLALGVAKEQARKDLPLSTYTKAWWTADLRNIYHFLGLRMDAHAQKEIRSYATTFGEEIIAPLFPCSWEAFCHYELDALRLTALDIQVIKSILHHTPVGQVSRLQAEFPEDWTDKSREKQECLDKLFRLGFAV